LSLPNFTPELFSNFDHVGILPTQDKSGGNELQVKAAGVLDRKPIYGGKERLRVPIACDIHGFARCMTAQFFLMSNWISGAIAFAITLKGPGKLAELHEIIGRQLAKIAVICRRTFPIEQHIYIYIYTNIVSEIRGGGFV
jgi:hypothetical protein